MATLEIGGQRIQVDDKFLSLSHDEQNKTVEEIASHLKAASVADSMSQSVRGAATEGTRGLARGFVGGSLSTAANILPGVREARQIANYVTGGLAPEPGGNVVLNLGLEQKKGATTAQKYAGTIGEFLGNPVTYFGPGGWIAKTLMAVGGAVGSEAAGEIPGIEGTRAEPVARVVGAMLGGPLAARAVKPKLGQSQQALADAGVSMTPGQAFPGPGGAFKTLEDAATAIPLLGSFIKGGQQRSVQSFNKAVANQALEPIGEKLSRGTDAGHDLVGEVQKKLGDAYDKLLPKVNYVPDAQLAQDFSNIHARDVSILPQPQIEQFQRIIDTRLGPPAPMSGKMLKNIESELNHISSNYLSSSDGAQRGLGQALQNVITAIRENLERSNPDQAQELSRINAGYAMFARIRDAASRRSTSEGVFTPADLLASIKKGDKSVAKGAFARGDALMQTFAEAGQEVLPSKVPTSGTSERLATMGLLGGGSYLAHNPLILAGGAAGIAPYTPIGMSALRRYAAPQTGARAAFSEAGRGLAPLGRSAFQALSN